MTHSYWQEAPLLHHPLKTDFNHDIVIVGAGIAGLTTAYALSEKGFNPVIIDKFSPDSGETHYTSAHLASVIDDRFIHIEKWHGKKGAQLAYQSHAAAIDFIEKIVKRYDIDCDFKRLNGYLFSQKKEASFFLQKELLASWRAGHREVNLMTSIPLKGFEGATALRFPYQAQFEPARYMLGLLKVLQQRGLQIFSDTQIENWEEKNDKILLTTSRGIKIRCNQVIFACNEPFVRFRYFTLQAPYRTYALVFEVPEAIVHDGLYWDTEDPYHYIRFATKEGSPQEHVLIVGGEDHKTGQNPHTDEQWEKLEHWTRSKIPQVGKVLTRWSGQILETMDGLALIGADQPSNGKVYLISGDSGMGLTHGTLGGLLIADLLSQTPNPWAKLYDPHRFRWRAFLPYLRENLNTLWQYRNWFKTEESAMHRLQQGDGVIVQEGLHKVAQVRDENGEEQKLCAVCPHLGGLVQWNQGEKTWDCQCHGSRFSEKGEVINGPAREPLKAMV